MPGDIIVITRREDSDTSIEAVVETLVEARDRVHECMEVDHDEGVEARYRFWVWDGDFWQPYCLSGVEKAASLEEEEALEEWSEVCE